MNLPLAPLGAALLGAGAAVGIAVLPTSELESLVMSSGIASVIAAAEPPLGMTARLALAGGTGLIAGVFAWFALFLLLGTRGLTVGAAASQPDSEEAVPVPSIRRADAHPDAPPRPPLLATRDLGTPFLDVSARNRPEADAAARKPLFEAVSQLAEPVAEQSSPVEEPEVAAPTAPDPVAMPNVQAAAPSLQPAPIMPSIADFDAPVAPRIVLPAETPLPEDLDQPLAAFDPSAIRPNPAPPPRVVSPLRRGPRPSVFDSGERFETFELTPVRRVAAPQETPPPAPRAAVRPETEATIHALLDRLEKGVVDRGLASGVEPARKQRDSERGLEEALVSLRNLARRAS